MTFYETRFPDEISRGSSGGPTRLTQVVTLRSGHEQRNTPWASPLHKYDAATGIRTLTDLDEVVQFWQSMYGRLHGFRWKDWVDYRSRNGYTPLFSDQTIGTGTGVLTAFQLVKTYTTGAASYVRTINKPVSGTVKIGVNGVEVTSGWSVSTTTGIVTFSTAPTNGHVVTAGYEFDVPVRFGDDDLNVTLEGWEAGSAQSIPIVELRL
jgi:uncharacterized protein (TIGR02217 family)